MSRRYRIAGQFDGTRIPVFVVDQLWSETHNAGSITPCEVGFHVGRRIVDQPFWFHGAVDEVRVSDIVWNHLIQSLMMIQMLQATLSTK